MPFIPSLPATLGNTLAVIIPKMLLRLACTDKLDCGTFGELSDILLLWLTLMLRLSQSDLGKELVEGWYLSNSKNKSNMADFLMRDWAQQCKAI